MRKKFLIALTCLTLTCLFVACGRSEEKTTTAKKAEPTTTSTTAKKKAITSTKAKKSTQANVNLLINANFATAPVMSGDGTEKIGDRGYIIIAKDMLKKSSQSDFKEFVKKRVKDSGLNWVSIRCDDGTGICFEGSVAEMATYGQMAKDGTITKTIGYIQLKNGKYVYSK